MSFQQIQNMSKLAHQIQPPTWTNMPSLGLLKCDLYMRQSTKELARGVDFLSEICLFFFTMSKQSIWLLSWQGLNLSSVSMSLTF